jgi:hypothetical protein
MNCSEITHRIDQPPSVCVAHTIVSEHPIIAVKRWNDHNKAEEVTGRNRAIVVLQWYAPLNESEEAEIRRAGIDLDRVDTSAFTTE